MDLGSAEEATSISTPIEALDDEHERTTLAPGAVDALGDAEERTTIAPTVDDPFAVAGRSPFAADADEAPAEAAWNEAAARSLPASAMQIPPTREVVLPEAAARAQPFVESTMVLTEAQMRGEAPVPLRPRAPARPPPRPPAPLPPADEEFEDMPTDELAGASRGFATDVAIAMPDGEEGDDVAGWDDGTDVTKQRVEDE